MINATATATVSRVAPSLSFLHDEATVLQDLYDGSDGLAHLAAHAGAALEGATPQEVLRWAVDRFGQRLVVTSSMADGVLAHMAAGIRPGIRVLFVDTGYHFAETIGTADALASTLQIDLVSVRPHLTVADQDAAFGQDLFARDPDLCCAMRKVAPLAKALAPYVAWASGIRRDETTTRSQVGVVEWDERHEMVKVNPLATWTHDDVQRYIVDNDVLVNPLMSEGYGSIGCAPCTNRGEGRTGRWLGLPKVECGLHG
ncbi:MAG TPA: phosphoadenylyl-sulfate reductase [Mycobacteriales bacterium]|nr:phosphoadenylyl-sulfate reductase [Mycobacteriales bacterium]